jgi:oxygen-independent coproporphyrinogen-3 oxidase
MEFDMESKTLFNKQMIERYDCAGPRYTSYPTALQFSTAYSSRDYVEWVETSNADPIPSPLSLYFHIPFCNTICYYCGCSKIITKDPAKASEYVRLLQREIKLQGALFDSDRKVTQMHWGGGTPTFLQDGEIQAILDCARKHFSFVDEADGEFSIEVDPRTVDAARITRLRNMGFNRISFGVQDFETDVQVAVNRVQDPAQIIANVDAARSSGFASINMDLMYGLPKQTVKSFKRTLDHVIAISPDRLAIYNYAHLPDLFKPQRRIEASELPSAADKLEILQLCIERLQQAGYVYIGMDHFAKADDALVRAQQLGTLQRNFQGYSTHADCDIVAMGITAISSVGDNYSQNVKSIDDYACCLLQDQIPVYRGIELEPDDILRREIISELMCNFRLDLRHIEAKWGIEFNDYFDSARTHLRHMANDGLVEMTADTLQVSAAGRLLVRSVCMEFDRYLQERKKEERYSRII